MARLFADENFPLQVVEALRTFGHDVTTIQAVGLGELRTPDEAVLAYAHAQQRIVLTLNRRDFIRLHEQRPDHSGVVVCTVDPDWVGQAQRVAEGELQGRLIRVNRPER